MLLTYNACLKCLQTPCQSEECILFICHERYFILLNWLFQHCDRHIWCEVMLRALIFHANDRRIKPLRRIGQGASYLGQITTLVCNSRIKWSLDFTCLYAQYQMFSWWGNSKNRTLLGYISVEINLWKANPLNHWYKVTILRTIFG